MEASFSPLRRDPYGHDGSWNVPSFTELAAVRDHRRIEETSRDARLCVCMCTRVYSHVKRPGGNGIPTVTSTLRPSSIHTVQHKKEPRLFVEMLHSRAGARKVQDDAENVQRIRDMARWYWSLLERTCPGQIWDNFSNNVSNENHRLCRGKGRLPQYGPLWQNIILSSKLSKPNKSRKGLSGPHLPKLCWRGESVTGRELLTETLLYLKHSST